LHGGASAGTDAGTGTGELKNFYSFQQRQEKQNTLLRLREQFEEDKRKIAELKAQRKFKPF
jgi:ribosomal RNA-processing protein 7